MGNFDKFAKGEINGSQLRAQVVAFSLYLFYLAIGLFFLVYIATASLFIVGERVTSCLPLHYLKSVLSQNMAFFDILGASKVTSNLTSNIHLVQEAISGNISLTRIAAATCVTALIIRLIQCWKLALVLVGAVALWLSAATQSTRSTSREPVSTVSPARLTLWSLMSLVLGSAALLS